MLQQKREIIQLNEFPHWENLSLFLLKSIVVVCTFDQVYKEDLRRRGDGGSNLETKGCQWGKKPGDRIRVKDETPNLKKLFWPQPGI